MARGFPEQVNTMGQYEETYQIEAAIKEHLQAVMSTQIKEEASDAISEAVESEVYSHRPLYTGRPDTIASPRKKAGGLGDKTTYIDNYDPDSQELIIEVKTEWQNVGFRPVDGSGTGGNDLADVVEHNQMYHQSARPFIKRAEEIISANQNRLEDIIAQYLNRTV